MPRLSDGSISSQCEAENEAEGHLSSVAEYSASGILPEDDNAVDESKKPEPEVKHKKVSTYRRKYSLRLNENV